MDHALVSTSVLVIACDEMVHICCDRNQTRVASDGGVGGGDVAVVTQNSMKTSVVQVFTAARVGINIV